MSLALSTKSHQIKCLWIKNELLLNVNGLHVLHLVDRSSYHVTKVSSNKGPLCNWLGSEGSFRGGMCKSLGSHHEGIRRFRVFLSLNLSLEFLHLKRRCYCLVIEVWGWSYAGWHSCVFRNHIRRAFILTFNSVWIYQLAFWTGKILVVF